MSRHHCPHCKKSIYIESKVRKAPEKKGYESVKEAQYKKRKIDREKVYALYFVEHWGVKEIADKLNCSKETVYRIVKPVMKKRFEIE